MNITTKTENGKHIAEVRNGAGVVFKTAAYLTEAMALADAKCWLAFKGGKVAEIEMVWVPVDGRDEVQIPYADATRIGVEYGNVVSLRRAGEQYASHRLLKPLKAWAMDVHGLTSRDMREIYRWWTTTDAKARTDRGREIARQIGK
ncbi:hypothetical protein [Streptomyces collinus]